MATQPDLNNDKYLDEAWLSAIAIMHENSSFKRVYLGLHVRYTGLDRKGKTKRATRTIIISLLPLQHYQIHQKRPSDHQG